MKDKKKAAGIKFVGNHSEILKIKSAVSKVADSSATVLISGETGCGKEHLARYIHQQSYRSESPMVKVDFSTIPESLLDSELFGHEKGTFTGAVESKAGKFEIAEEGSLYLDNVLSMPPSYQPKLARVLQDREFGKLGGHNVIKLKARVIAACNEDIQTALKHGRLRKELYYTLNVFPIRIPPLRERLSDIPLLVRAFFDRQDRTKNKIFKRADPEIMKALANYHWPGNVRQLFNVLERATLLSEDGCITLNEIQITRNAPEEDLISTAAMQNWSLQELEKHYIISVLEKTGGNKTRAAEILKINRKTLLEKRKKYNLD